MSERFTISERMMYVLTYTYTYTLYVKLLRILTRRALDISPPSTHSTLQVRIDMTSEEPEAICLSPDWPPANCYSIELFRRNDDVTLLDLGFTYVDSTMMRGEVENVTWYVDLEAKRAPQWSYMVHGVHRSPVAYGCMAYDSTKRLDVLSTGLAKHHMHQEVHA